MVLSFLKHVVSYFSTPDQCPSASTKKAINLGKQRVQILLSKSGATFNDICLSVEQSENKNDLDIALDCFNRIIWTLKVAAPTNDVDRVVFQALKEMGYSTKLGLYLNSVPTTDQAIMSYKTAIVQELSENIKRLEEFKRRDKSFQEHLFNTYFPVSNSLPSEVDDTAKEQPAGHSLSSPPFCVKRKISEIFEDRRTEWREALPESKRNELHSQQKELTDDRKRRRSNSSSPQGRSPKVSSARRIGRMCPHFKDGRCRRGSDCKLIHAY